MRRARPVGMLKRRHTLVGALVLLAFIFLLASSSRRGVTLIRQLIVRKGEPSTLAVLSNAVSTTKFGDSHALTVSEDKATSLITAPEETRWFFRPQKLSNNKHFSLDPAIMPDSFLEHLQFMSNKIASKWKANGWHRFDKRDISECGSELPLTAEEASFLTGDGKSEPLKPRTKIEGLPECQIWKAVPPTSLTVGNKATHLRAEDATADLPLFEEKPLNEKELLSPEQLDRPYRKCCVEHAKLRDTAFFVFDHLEANNITYFLSTGTALGAIRHKGTIIPWDTDVDIAIYPSDADRAKKLFKGLSKDVTSNEDKTGPVVRKHHYSPDPQGKPMFWVHSSKDGRPLGGPHVEIFYDAVYTSYPESLLPLVRCTFYGRPVYCPNPKMFKVWFPSGWEAYAGGHYHGKGRCTVYVKGVRIETDKC